MSQRPVLILGATGMLGHKMFQRLSTRFPTVYGTSRTLVSEPRLRNVALLRDHRIIQCVDAAEWSNLKNLLREVQPAWTVNCVGVIKQRESAKAAIPSLLINSLLPHRIAEEVSAWDGRVIHFSTDCVFSGRKGMYTEQDESDALDLYGKSKYLGEVAVQNALTLRTSIIGRELTEFRSLLEWFLSKRGQRIQGYRKALYSGVTTNYLADTVGDLIERGGALHGLYQLASQPISKYDLLCLIRDTMGIDIDIQPVEGEICDRTMIGARFEAATGRKTPEWPELIRQIAQDATPYEEWRTTEHASRA
jgi:dTDP-4-dehydrorhamnose reductase